MDEPLELRTRPASGAVFSVRVPREVAIGVDDYATAHGLSVSEVVRIALDQLLGGVAMSGQGGYTIAHPAPLTISWAAAAPTQRTRSVAETKTAYLPSPS